MFKVINIFVEEQENLGCSNGNYTQATIKLNNGEKVFALTCKCGRGCSGTDIIPVLNSTFKNIKDLHNYMGGEL